MQQHVHILKTSVLHIPPFYSFLPR